MTQPLEREPQAKAMARIAVELASEERHEVAAERVVKYAVEISNARAAVLLEPDRHGVAHISAATDEVLAGQVMIARQASGEGSAPASWTQVDEVLMVDDLWNDPRWPKFGDVMRDLSPVRSALALRLALNTRYLGLLTLFHHDRGYFGAEVRQVMSIYAQHAAIALAHVSEHERAVTLEQGLQSNRLIGAATGVLMATRHLSRDDAYELLRRTSQNLNRKLFSVAEHVLWTGDLPDN